IFFFQAEDGIRDFHVTGVQTCALPISILSRGPFARVGPAWIELKRIKAKGDPTVITLDVTPEGPEIGTDKPGNTYRVCAVVLARSEERRVGKEGRGGGGRWRIRRLV